MKSELIEQVMKEEPKVCVWVFATLKCWKEEPSQQEHGFPMMWRMVAINLASCQNSSFILGSRVSVCS